MGSKREESGTKSLVSKLAIAEREAAERERGAARILVVDDEAQVRTMMCATLEEQGLHR